ncbi:MAG: TraB/GumN family protein [Acidiferrobacteraceae bacterium]|jgi:uncharacterized protein YbaP (TraB family)
MPRFNTKRVLIALVALATLVAGAPAAAASHEHGLLWKISGHGYKPSWLFGTIHSSDPRVTRLAPPLTRVFDSSSSYSMELIFSGPGFVHMAESMYLPEDEKLENLIGDDLYKRVRTTLSDMGVATDDLNYKKPWAVILSLGSPHASQGLFLDMLLQVRATMQLKPTFGLESMDEQIAVFNDMSTEDQVSLLTEAMRTQAQARNDMPELMRAYLNRDLTQLYSISKRMESRTGSTYSKLMNRLLVQRNLRMLKRMQPRLKEGNAFIAVGALHLAGPDGLLALLRKNGYRTEAVY